MTHRESFEAELKRVVVPRLRERKFTGSFPHFRRPDENGIQLLTFQFDKNGGGLVIEIARCPSVGTTTHWGKQIPPSKVTAWDLHPNDRERIKPKSGAGTDSWFRYEGEKIQECVEQVLAALSVADH